MSRSWVSENVNLINRAAIQYHIEPKLKERYRLGQYIYDKCAPPGSDPWPELFYETDHKKVYQMLNQVVDGWIPYTGV